MLHDLPDTASTLQNKTSEVKKPEVAAKRNDVRERERAHTYLFQKMQRCSAMTKPQLWHQKRNNNRFTNRSNPETMRKMV
jgi:hypothetical protein